ncbi:MAG: single-stranded-DNA-specific exonuclease RecJ [Planctomycetes bacterium]|nr:single-stranded-DNA-specific exonuclease RecJ [Planctomycetota bacterium]
MQATWQLGERDPVAEERLVAEVLVSPLLAAILHRRGFSDPTAARAFLQPRLTTVEDPACLKDLRKGAARLARAIRERELVLVYGDYDVDGMSGTVILLNFIRQAGGRAECYIPNRLKEGYSFNPGALDTILGGAEKPTLLLTVDHGTSANAGIARLADAGVDVIVTDHHHPPANLPDRAYALINPRQADCPSTAKDLCGAGVAFKLAWGTAIELDGATRVSPALREFLVQATAMVAIASITDVVPLTGENRVLCRHGLAALGKVSMPGLDALMRIAKLDGKAVQAVHIGFRIGPRLNAAARLGMAEKAVELLSTRSVERAAQLASELDAANDTRRGIEREMLEEVLACKELRNFPGDRGICLGKKNWHAGVIGIVAARLAERFQVPTMMVALNGEEGRGSARSRTGVNLAELIHELLPLVVSGGGHAGAAGCTVTEAQFPAFQKAFEESAARLLRSAPAPALHADVLANFAQLGPRFVQELEQLAPHGAGNPIARFVTRRCKLVGAPRRVGRDRSVLQFMVREGEMAHRCVGFGLGERLPELIDLPEVDLLYELSFDDYRGAGNIQLQVIDFRLC